uniref:Uncharacterized protein n=1 Tax=Caenorhabditis japonica TaxID=281687 RepID=A0A8R1DJ03_CAEJA
MVTLPENNVMRYFSMAFTAVGIALAATSLFSEHWVEVEVINPRGHNLLLHRGLIKWVCINQKDVGSHSCIAKYPVYPGWLRSVFLCMCVGLETYVFKGLTVFCHLGWSYWLSVGSIIISILCTALETVQIFLNSDMGYSSTTLPPEAMATWKYTM